MKFLQYLIPVLLFSLIVCKAEISPYMLDSTRLPVDTEGVSKTELINEFEKKSALIQAEIEKKEAIALEEKKRSQLIIYVLTGTSLIGFILALIGFRRKSQR